MIKYNISGDNGEKVLQKFLSLVIFIVLFPFLGQFCFFIFSIAFPFGFSISGPMQIKDYILIGLIIILFLCSILIPLVVSNLIIKKLTKSFGKKATTIILNSDKNYAGTERIYYTNDTDSNKIVVEDFDYDGLSSPQNERDINSQFVENQYTSTDRNVSKEKQRNSPIVLFVTLIFMFVAACLILVNSRMHEQLVCNSEHVCHYVSKGIFNNELRNLTFKLDDISRFYIDKKVTHSKDRDGHRRTKVSCYYNIDVRTLKEPLDVSPKIYDSFSGYYQKYVDNDRNINEEYSEFVNKDIYQTIVFCVFFIVMFSIFMSICISHIKDKKKQNLPPNYVENIEQNNRRY